MSEPASLCGSKRWPAFAVWRGVGRRTNATSRLLGAREPLAVERAPSCIAEDLLGLEEEFLEGPVGVGGKVPRGFRSSAASLSAAILGLYAPDFDEDVAMERLLDRDGVRALAARPRPEPLDERGAVRPLPLEDVLVLAAQGSEFALDGARATLGPPPFDTAPSTAAAWNDWAEAVQLAIGAFSPLRVAFALRPIFARWSPKRAREQVLEPETGRLFSIPTITTRTLIGHALAESLEAFARVFPDALTICRRSRSAHPEDAGARDDAATRPRPTSPFRERQRELALGHEFDVEAEELVRRSGAAAPFERTMRHLREFGNAHAATQRAAGRVKLVDRLNVFSDSREEAAVKLHRARQREREDLLTASIAEWSNVELDAFRNVETHRRLQAVYDATLGVQAVVVSTPSTFQARFGLGQAQTEVFGHEQLRAQLAALQPLASAATGMQGGLAELGELLTGPAPTGAMAEPVLAIRAAMEATEHGQRLLARLPSANASELVGLMGFASAHPSTSLYFGVLGFMDWSRQFVARSVYDDASKQYKGVLYGRMEFLDAFAVWARDLMRALGPGVSASQFLELAMLKKFEAIAARTGGPSAE